MEPGRGHSTFVLTFSLFLSNEFIFIAVEYHVFSSWTCRFLVFTQGLSGLRSTVGNQELRPMVLMGPGWNRKFIYRVQWLLGPLWYSTAIMNEFHLWRRGEKNPEQKKTGQYVWRCPLPGSIYFSEVRSNLSCWLLVHIFQGEGFSPEEHLPLYFYGENTGSGEAGVRMKQEDGAILREEELFHHNSSPHQLRWQKGPFSHSSVSKPPAICVYMSFNRFHHHLLWNTKILGDSSIVSLL